MPLEQLQAYTNQLRTLRTSQPVLLKKLREEVEDEPEMKKPNKTKSTKTDKTEKIDTQKLLNEYLP